jgi:hypothetical protein
MTRQFLRVNFLLCADLGEKLKKGWTPTNSNMFLLHSSCQPCRPGPLSLLREGRTLSVTEQNEDVMNKHLVSFLAVSEKEPPAAAAAAACQR